jgi:hypothetical protein
LKLIALIIQLASVLLALNSCWLPRVPAVELGLLPSSVNRVKHDSSFDPASSDAWLVTELKLTLICLWASDTSPPAGVYAGGATILLSQNAALVTTSLSAQPSLDPIARTKYDAK